MKLIKLIIIELVQMNSLYISVTGLDFAYIADETGSAEQCYDKYPSLKK